MKKQYNISNLADNLSSSVFFQENKTSGIDNQTDKKTPVNEELVIEPNPKIPERPNGKRIITRNSFEIYEDQMDSLRKLSYHEKMQGKLGSMSGMVREAIDTYLLKKNHGK